MMEACSPRRQCPGQGRRLNHCNYNQLEVTQQKREAARRFLPLHRDAAVVFSYLLERRSVDAPLHDPR
jgi:hypothetical protein